MTDLETLLHLCRAVPRLTDEVVGALADLVGKAQNGPPDGGADGTINEATWHAAADLAETLTKAQLLLDAFRKAHQPLPADSTQLEQLNAIFADVPGEPATWLAISDRLEHLRRTSDPDYKGPERDDTIDYITWAHLRNINRVVRDMAQAFAALERGNDPDIPF